MQAKTRQKSARSECVSVTGHTYYKECTNRDRNTIPNCQGNNGTLAAAVCPTRKELIKEKRGEKKEKKTNFEIESTEHTVMVTKLRTELHTKAVRP